MEPKDLINWAELSRLLAGTRSVITRNRIGKKHEKEVSDLLSLVQQWNDNRKKM